MRKGFLMLDGDPTCEKIAWAFELPDARDFHWVGEDHLNHFELDIRADHTATLSHEDRNGGQARRGPTRPGSQSKEGTWHADSEIAAWLVVRVEGWRPDGDATRGGVVSDSEYKITVARR